MYASSKLYTLPPGLSGEKLSYLITHVIIITDINKYGLNICQIVVKHL
jgi:hypothetical protein